MKKNIGRIWYSIIIVGFLATLYWVEGSGLGGQAVADYNGGYGTFDMKEYNAQVVGEVLGVMEPEGFRVSYGYYLGDFLFVIFFGLLQLSILRGIFGLLVSRFRSARILFWLSMVFVVIRGLSDILENLLLLGTLMSYPVINQGIIEISAVMTQIKLGCIRAWVLILLASLVFLVFIVYRDGQDQKKRERNIS